MRRVGLLMAIAWLLMGAGASVVAPSDPERSHSSRGFAPPTRVHVFDDDNGSIALHFHPTRLVNRLERTFAADPGTRIPIVALAGGRLFASADPMEPLLLLGADGLGRDVFSRLVTGARISLALALLAAALATAVGVAAGLLAGYLGGTADAAFARVSEFVLVLPALYVVVVLRSAMPLVLSAQAVFALLVFIFAVVAWPIVGRGVRAIAAAERTRDYVEAARAAGGSSTRVLVRHLMPSVLGFAATQFALLVPACLVFEGALSFAGLAFSDDLATWGTMLQEAGNVGALSTAPWLLAPAVSIVTVVLAVNLIVEAPQAASGRATAAFEPGTTLALPAEHLPTTPALR